MQTDSSPYRGNAIQNTVKKILMLVALLLCCTAGFGQSYEAINKRIDSLVKLDLPKSALLEVDKMEQLSRKEKNTAQQVKAAIYRMKFVAEVEENAFPAIIERLRLDITKANYPLKPVLQSLLGTMYWNYYKQNRWAFAQRTHIEKPGNDITKWDLEIISVQAANLFRASLTEYKREQETPVDVLNDVLTGDRELRYLRPTLYDLLVQRALEYFTQEEPAIVRPKMPFNLNDERFFSDSGTFVNLSVKTTDTASTFYQALKYYQQATLFHLAQPYAEALADLDLHRLEFVNRASALINKENLYLKALNAIAIKFAAKPVSADALLLIGKHYSDADSLVRAHAYYKKAVDAFPKSYGGLSAQIAMKNIEQQQLTAVVEDVNIPGKALLALVNYRNVKQARVLIYKISATQHNMLAKIKSDQYPYADGTVIYPSDSVLNYLKKLQPVQKEVLTLPGTTDYHRHNAEFKINPLTSGHYVLVLHDEHSANTGLVQLTTIKVCNIAYVTRRNADGKVELRTLNRETGKPMPNVGVSINDAAPVFTDANGACYFSGLRNFSVKLTTAADTLYSPNRYVNELYNPNTTSYNTVLFTDRAMYRPGQTVYFKGMQLENSNGRSKIVTDIDVDLTVTDNNNKPIINLPQMLNEFGTFAGSFIIPQNILNGTIRISTPNGSKWVRVEEYKRPTFKVDFLPVKGSYKTNDMVTLSGKVMAYSGFGLSKARVVYHITRMAEQKYYPDARNKFGNTSYRNGEIAVDTIKTNEQGKFEIKFKAVADAGVNINNLNYRFNIEATVTDGSAETQSATAYVTVGAQNLIASFYMGRVRAVDSIQANLLNYNGVKQSGKLRLQIYALQQPEGLFKSRLWGNPDQFLMGKGEYKKNFTEFSYRDEDEKTTWKVLKQVADMSMPAGEVKPTWFKMNVLNGLPTGTYKAVLHATNKAGDTTSVTTYSYFDNGPGIPQNNDDWLTIIKIRAVGGGVTNFLVGRGDAATVLMEKYNGDKIVSSRWLNIPKGKQQPVSVMIAADERNVSVQFLMVSQNRVYRKYVPIITRDNDDKLDIKFITHRDKLQPGEKETWKLQVTGKNKAVQAEMLANLYDASLDNIAGSAGWDNPVLNRYRRPEQFYTWDYGQLSVQNNTNVLKYNYPRYVGLNTSYRNYESLNLFGYNYYGQPNMRIVLRGMASTNIVSRDLEEVAVSSINQVRVNGKSFVAADTEEYKASSYVMGGSARRLPADIIEGIQTVDDYGDQAGNDGPNKILNFDESFDPALRDKIKTIALRSNFSETAFFYPQLRTNEKGEVLVEFTIPQSLTQWKFRAYAHTKDLSSGYMESTVVTQKQLSISANMPRFLREGDTVTVSARLANLTAGALKGKVNLVLLNAINLKPVSLLINAADAEQNFDVAANGTKAVSFRLVVPFGIDALTYRLTADAGAFTDGEENTLPVLPNRMLVTESMPMMVRAGQTKSFNFDKLISQSSTTLKSKTLTLEYTQNPAWYAIQALPYMMEFPYECSEQIFSRYYANSLGTSLVNKMPVVKQVFDQWKATNSGALLSNLEKNQELKATLLEETPWLRDAINESEQKKRVALLFDLNKMSYELQTNLAKLKDRQMANGGFPWFGGDKADPYITRHILAGIGQLYHLGIVDTKNLQLKDIADKAMTYLDNTLLDDAALLKSRKEYDNRTLGSTEIHAYYTQSYFTARAMPANIKELLNDYLAKAETQWLNQSLYEQGLIALTMLRFNKPDVAKKIIASLTERSQQTDELGMYWGKNQLGYFWYQSPIATQCLMIELFAEAGETKSVQEMKIWLLRSKQTTNWKTTTATAAACYALLLKGDNLLADNGTSVIKLDGKNLNELKPDLKAEAGTGYIKTNWTDEQVKPALGKVSIANQSKTISWGALHWQYLENLDKITPSSTDIHLERKYFVEKQSPNGPLLIAVDAKHQPKTGDLLKVIVYLKAGRDFEYVQLKDMRPAGTEPVDVLSGYKYQDGMYYYQVSKDVATNFFISYLTKGTHVFEYRLRVAQPGSFSTGISTVQCMYAPEFNAHSEGSRMVIE